MNIDKIRINAPAILTRDTKNMSRRSQVVLCSSGTSRRRLPTVHIADLPRSMRRRKYFYDSDAVDVVVVLKKGGFSFRPIQRCDATEGCGKDTRSKMTVEQFGHFPFVFPNTSYKFYPMSATNDFEGAVQCRDTPLLSSSLNVSTPNHSATYTSSLPTRPLAYCAVHQRLMLSSQTGTGTCRYRHVNNLRSQGTALHEVSELVTVVSNFL
jgi:hypothetical protein